MPSTKASGTVQGFFSDVRRWERENPRLTWSDGLLVTYCVLFWVVAGQGLLENLLEDDSPASSALVCGITGITAWAALPPLQLITPWPAARRALRAAVSILSIGAGAAALGLLHSLGLPAQRDPPRDGTHLPGHLRDRHAAAHRSGSPLRQPVGL